MNGKIVSLNAGPVIEKLRQGRTVGQVAQDLGISANTFRKWTISDPEFGEQVRQAIEEAKAAGLRRKGGRPRRSEHTPPAVPREHVNEQEVLAAVAAGHPRSHAAAIAGVPPLTLDRWLAEDPAFLMRVEAAEGLLQRTMLARIHEAATNPQQWTAAAWILERRFPETFAKRAEVSRTERIKTATAIGGEMARAVLAALEDSGLPPDDQQLIRERLAGAVERVASQAS